MEGIPMANYDKKVLDCFKVAETHEEADEFLEMMFAVVVKGKRAVRKYFEETGVDMTGEDIMQASEVFDVGDGRYLIVEG